jgi:hypothetical protein
MLHHKNLLKGARALACVQHIVYLLTVFKQYVVVFIMWETPVVFGELLIKVPLIGGLKPSQQSIQDGFYVIQNTCSPPQAMRRVFVIQQASSLLSGAPQGSGCVGHI